MLSQIRIRIGEIVIFASLFAAGCMAEEDVKRDLASNASEGATGDLAVERGTTAFGPFTVIPLAADQPGAAPNVAPEMINPWGMVPFDRMCWTADNGTGVLSIVDGEGRPPRGTPASGQIKLEEGITGMAATGVSPDEATLFQMHAAGVCKPALLIVASETGRLFGVNPDVSTDRGFVVADRSKAGAIYMGVTVLERKHGRRGPLILAADFHNDRIDVFDADFELVTDISFEARGLPQGFAPFNVAVLDDTVYVAYAKQDADRSDEVAGPGLGFVAAFRPDGTLRRIARGRALNAPWGLELARRFGPLRHALLVGNFGDGHVTAIDPYTMKIRGQLTGRNRKPIAIDGLWALSFAAGVRNARPDGLYFTAGPDEESHGLFGVIVPGQRCVEGGCKTDP